MPQQRILEPAPARLYNTVGVSEEILQVVPSPGFWMPNANGRYIPYDGTSDPTNLDIRFAVEPSHNYPRIQQGASKLEVLNKHGISCEIEMTMYNNGTALAAGDLTIGKTYGVTQVGAAVTGNGTGKPIWTVDPTKTAATNMLVRVTAIDLRGFTTTGRIPNMDTGTIGDYTARVLVYIYR